MEYQRTFVSRADHVVVQLFESPGGTPFSIDLRLVDQWMGLQEEHARIAVDLAPDWMSARCKYRFTKRGYEGTTSEHGKIARVIDLKLGVNDPAACPVEVSGTGEIPEGRLTDVPVKYDLHHMSTTLHMGVICIQLGRKLRWDTKDEAFIGDDEANRPRKRPAALDWEKNA